MKPTKQQLTEAILVIEKPKLDRAKLAKRNRGAGHSYERSGALAFQAIGFEHVRTSRAESRSRDNQGIDLCHQDEDKNGRFPYNVQYKCAGAVNYTELLKGIKKHHSGIAVVIHKKMERANENFVTKDRLAVLQEQDFMAMVQRIKELESINKQQNI